MAFRALVKRRFFELPEDRLLAAETAELVEEAIGRLTARRHTNSSNSRDRRRAGSPGAPPYDIAAAVLSTVWRRCSGAATSSTAYPTTAAPTATNVPPTPRIETDSGASSAPTAIAATQTGITRP